MKLPSLASLSRNAIIVFKRFPILFITVVFNLGPLVDEIYQANKGGQLT